MRDSWARFKADRAFETDAVSTHPRPLRRFPATSFLKRFNVWYVLFSVIQYSAVQCGVVQYGL